MNRKFFVLTFVFVLIASLSGSSLSGVRAGSQPPPAHIAPLQTMPQRTPERIASPSLSPQVTLGQPGLSFRYLQTFGVTGEPYQPDALHLYKPMGLYIDSVDNLYVAEETGFRVLVYNATGANILAIGNAGDIYGEGAIPWPHDVAKNSNYFWVTTNLDVRAFDQSGKQVLAFPQDAHWPPGNDNSHFYDPIGIAFDHNGLLFVSDMRNHRIQLYSVSGTTLTYVNTIGTTSIPGNDNVHFNLPGMIAFDSSNALYVADMNNYRVQKCTSIDNWANWTCTKFFGGTQGSDPSQGQLSSGTWSVTLDSSDNVFIADGTNYRVLKCTLAGVCAHFVGTVGVKGNDNNHFGWVSDVTIDTTGKVYVADYENMRIQVYTPAGIYTKTIGVTGIPYSVDTVRYYQPWGVSAANDGGLYILENTGARLIKLNPDGSQSWTAGKAGVSGTGNDTFGVPSYHGASGNPAETQDGKIYAPDAGNNRIQIFNAATGVYLSTFGQGGQGNSQFYGPSGVAINPTSQDILVVDQYNHRVQIYTSNWVYKATIGVTGVSGEDNSHLNRPRGAAVDSNGAVFVADSENSRVQKCTTSNGTTYTCSTFVNSTGNGSGGFDDIHPVGVAVDSAGHVFLVSDSYNHLQVYDASGAFLTSLGYTCCSQLWYPVGVAVDRNGNVYMSEQFNHRVRKYTPGVPGWKQVNINGLGTRQNEIISALAPLDSQLYAGTSNFSGTGAQIWRMDSTGLWSSVVTDGFGNANTQIIGDLAEFGGKLYAATQNDLTGGEIWRTTNGTSWERVVSSGFGDPTNVRVHSLAEFDNMIYAGTYSGTPEHGLEIWRSATGDSGSWSRVVSNGFNADASNTVAGTMESFEGALYVGTTNTDTGAEIWRSTNGADWFQVNVDGFGDTSSNEAVSGLEVFHGALYATTFGDPINGGEVWRSTNGTSWTKVLNAGFFGAGTEPTESLIAYEDHLYLMTLTDWTGTGVQVYRSADGNNWEQINPDGFGDSENRGAHWDHAVEIFNDSLFFGTRNSANGGEIWQMQRSLYLPMVKR